MAIERLRLILDGNTGIGDLQTILLLILGTRGSEQSQVPQASLTGEALEFHGLINQHRISVRCSVLEEHQTVSGVASNHSRDMQQRNFFNHTNPDGTTFAQRLANAGIRYQSAGENIAMGYRTAQAVFDGWLNSDGHKRNMENCSFTHHGVGYEPNGHYWTNKFVGNPR